jgi:hypothetical protein
MTQISGPARLNGSYRIKVLAAEPHLNAHAVGEIEAGLRALAADGGTGFP